MAKRAASPAPVTPHLPDSAQQHLTTLRGEIESRLATLEEVLADPSRGESLAGLILDLSRIATEEAQAAAAQACQLFRTEADRQVAEQRVAAAAAIEATQAGLRTAHDELETERATTQHLRRETEQAQLELGKLRELGAVKDAAKEKLERELKALRETGARQKTAEADLQRHAADLKQQLESEQRATTDAQTLLNAERAIVADLRREADQFHSEAARVTERLAALERVQADARAEYEREQAESHAAYERSLKDAAAAQERALADVRAVHERAQEDARTAYDTIAQDLERERTAAAYAHAELQSQVDSLRAELDAERGQSSELRQAVQRAEERSATLEREQAAIAGLERAHAELQSQLDRERAEFERQVDSQRGEFERQLASQRAEFDADRGQSSEARTALDAERGRNAQLLAELDAERGQHVTLRAEFDAERGQQVQLRTELDAERSQSAELRRALQEAEERSASSSGGDALETRQLELAALSQAALADAHKALAEAQADLQRERSSNAELRQAAESSDQLLASSRSNEVQMLANVDQISAQLQRERGQAMEVIEALKTERDRVAAELEAAQKWIDDVRAAEAEFTPKPSPAASESKSKAKAATPPTPTEPPAVAPAAAAPRKEEPATFALSDEGWQTIRLTNRYIYNDGVPIQVNGDAGTLFDLSFTGCQILSPSALKPNQLIKIQLAVKVSCSGKVVWTRLEAAAGAQLLSYRAGVRFTKPDHAAIEAFAASHEPTSIVPDSDA